MRKINEYMRGDELLFVETLEDVIGNDQFNYILGAYISRRKSREALLEQISDSLPEENISVDGHLFFR